ncbi:uncharacterized protein LOC144369367 [Ictidomys tridecemlineatus]
MRQKSLRNGFLRRGAGMEPELERRWEERGGPVTGPRSSELGGGGQSGPGWTEWARVSSGGGKSEKKRGGGDHPLGPYLVQEQLQLGGAGAGDLGLIHVPAAPRGSARRPPPLTLHARRPGRAARRSLRREQFRLASSTCCLRSRYASLKAPAPGAAADSRRPPWARPRPTRQSGSAPPLASPPSTGVRPAPQVLGRPVSCRPATWLPGPAQARASRGFRGPNELYVHT